MASGTVTIHVRKNDNFSRGAGAAACRTPSLEDGVTLRPRARVVQGNIGAFARFFR
jgi:hypothetical protein